MNVKEIALGIGIIILVSFVVNYGIVTFYPEPNSEDFYPSNVYQFQTKNACVTGGGEWQATSGETGRCTISEVKQMQYQNARDNYSRNRFLISITLAILLIVAGALLFSIESVGAGIMGGGVITLIYGSANYWSHMENWLRFSVSLLGLIILIILGYVLNKKRKENLPNSV